MRTPLLSSVRWRILAVFLLGLVLPVTISAWISYRKARSIIYAQSLAHQRQVLDNATRDLWQLEDESRRQIESLGNEPSVVNALRHGTPLPTEVFGSYLRLNPHWSHLVVLDAVGKPVWGSKETGDPTSFDSFFVETFHTCT